MKNFYGRILPVLLALLLVFPLVGCQPDATVELPEKIKIEEDPAYSDETLLWAEQTIFSLVLYTYRNAVMDRIPEKTEVRLKSYAHRICQITAVRPIPEEQYRSAITLLAQDGKGVVDELLASQKSGKISYEKTRALYLELTYAFGAERVASMVYDACLLIYDARYEKAMERFEEYDYDFYQEEAGAIAAERAIFANGVQKESFSTLLKGITAVAELLAVNPEGLPQMFSDAELLDMIRHLDFSKVNISQEGWELLLSKVLKSKEGSYSAGLMQIFKESGDLSRVSGIMNDAVKLAASVMERLVPEHITALRAGEQEKLLVSVCYRFDDDDWALFTSVTSVALVNEQYSALAEATHGEAYLEYLASIEQVDVERLRESVGNASFYQNLLNYLAGICPAISYEVNL